MLGRQLRKRHLFRWEGRSKIGIDNLIDFQIDAIEEGTFEFRLDDSQDYQDMIYMHLRNNHAVLTQDNALTIYNDGNVKFSALLEDLQSERPYSYSILHFPIRWSRPTHL